MKLKVYGLRDLVALETLVLLTAPKDEMLKRNIKSLMAQGAPMFLENIQDKAIFEIGELDSSTGTIKSAVEPVQTAHCLELFEEMKEERRRFFGDEKRVDISKVGKEERKKA